MQKGKKWISDEKMRKKPHYSIVTAFVFVISCFVLQSMSAATMETDIQTIKEQAINIKFEKQEIYSEEVLRYFRYYGLQHENIRHHFGYFLSSEYSLAAHMFVPETYSATVIIMHGYLDHTGIVKNAIQHLLKQGYAVAVYDMPGHGLSSGDSADIQNFTQYLTVFKDFLALCQSILPGPYHIIGHSTGASVVMDYLLSEKKICFEHVILVAPLIHSEWYRVTRFGYNILRLFTTKIPRKFRKTSLDPDFVAFIKKKDPLSPKYLPLAWMQALFSWNNHMQKYPATSKKILVIQGDRDNIIDWKYNLKFITNKFKHMDKKIINRGGHQLFNEIPDIRKKVFNLIDVYLND
ncbi:alpha/beta hydrolase [bacterium]|nr:alpha/beta hydrolase [bacterium]